jgi:hypothetical protein
MAEFDRRLLVVGAALVAGCFFAGQSVGYRGIDLLFVISGLIALRRELVDAVARRLLTAFILSILLLMWDGLFRHALERHQWEAVSTLYWLMREILWHVLAAFLIGALSLFIGRSPLLLNWQRPAPPDALSAS